MQSSDELMKWNFRYVRYWIDRHGARRATWKRPPQPARVLLAFDYRQKGWPVAGNGTPLPLGDEPAVGRYDRYYKSRFLWRWWTPASYDMLARRGYGKGYRG